MIEVFRKSIVDLPKGLESTRLYQLLAGFDKAIRKTYSMKFNRLDEFPAIVDALKYFYTNPETITEYYDGENWIQYEDPAEVPIGAQVRSRIDEEARDTDLNYLTMLVLSKKMTREFVPILFKKNSDEPDFNLDGDQETFLTIESQGGIIDPTYITINLKSLEGKDSDTTFGLLENMLNHLLYFHNINFVIETFIQIITLELNNRYRYKTKNLNAVQYVRVE